MSSFERPIKLDCSNEASTNAISEFVKLTLKLKLTKEEAERVRNDQRIKQADM